MKSVIFDTDIGIDDAMALLMLHASPAIKLLGITTKFGNASVDDTTRNALVVKELFNIEAPVFKGAHSPIGTRLGSGYPTHVHGKDGLGDCIDYHPQGIADSMNAADALITLTKNAQDKVTIVAVGGLTNIAAAIRQDPAIIQRIDSLIVMGGAFGHNNHRGNVSPVAEANIASDPLAADLVFTSGLATIIVGLDVSHEIVMDQLFMSSLVDASPFAGEFIKKIHEHYFSFHHGLSGKFECPLHDSSAVAYLLKPELFSTLSAPVRVVTEGIAIGQTIKGDLNRPYVSEAWNNLPSCTICTGVHAAGVLELCKDTLAKYHHD